MNYILKIIIFRIRPVTIVFFRELFKGYIITRTEVLNIKEINMKNMRVGAHVVKNTLRY